MKWKESTASQCRWAEYLPWAGLDDYAQPEVLFDASEANYQGDVFALLKFDGNWHGNSYAIVEYSYGSCSGCDSWEDEPQSKVFQEIYKTILFFDDKEMLRTHRQNLAQTITPTHWQYDEKYDQLFTAIDKELNEKEGED